MSVLPRVSTVMMVTVILLPRIRATLYRRRTRRRAVTESRSKSFRQFGNTIIDLLWRTRRRDIAIGRGTGGRSITIPWLRISSAHNKHRRTLAEEVQEERYSWANNHDLCI
ncbi:hypothetical protein GYMLUDRAFT_476101 [Collybiopsis luxurians FD-317 M1]|uniref:Uncharacterized protein n=1 Tax=Collybiopsis luxurians FD-317 M1 TaxID=944289 RepID=A0A0D0C4J5_9AGAR|nr:hypothetical protein GYMLUDRAFT_476101 [Collybiopsis luxurians FD-317 M1]